MCGRDHESHARWFCYHNDCPGGLQVRSFTLVVSAPVFVLLSSSERLCRTASELKVKKLQPSAKQADTISDAVRLGLELDMSSGNAAENADRALSGVARKLDKTMSVEFTVNELISEATDARNLATIYYGSSCCTWHMFICADLIQGWGPHL